MPAPKGHPAYNVNGEGGRPKRYTHEYVDELANDLINWIDLDKENVFIEDWCLEHHIPEDAIAKELIKFERFSRAYNRLKTKQKVYLFKGTLKRKLLHNMSALILSHSHNVCLKTQQVLSGSASDPLAFCIESIDGNTKDLVNDTAKH